MISPSVRACVCASVRPIWGFPGFFSTPFHTATWNFAWGFSELCYTSSSRFVIVTTTVPELRALGFFTLGHMHVPVFRGFFYTVSYRNLKLCMRVSSVTLHIEFAFRHRDHYSSELRTLGFFTLGHMHVTVFSTPFHIGTWNFACGFSELHYTSSSRYVVVTTTVLELSALGFFTRNTKMYDKCRIVLPIPFLCIICKYWWLCRSVTWCCQ